MREETPIGVTALQDDIAAQLRAAAIPEAYIDMIMGLIACGEQARQDLEDAEVIQALAEAQLEAEQDRQLWEDLRAHSSWTASTK